MTTENTRADHATRRQGTLTRRDVLSASALAGGALLLSGRQSAAALQSSQNAGHRALHAPSALQAYNAPHAPPGEPGKDYTPVVVPNGWTLPYTIVDGWKVFHMVAEEVEHEFAPNLKATCWGYNGSVHGPVLELVEGDRVRIFVTNRLAALTTVHWHGVILESGMDGVGGLTQKAIAPGETYMYEFTLRQHGTLMYHSHHDEMTQMGLGMTGMIVVHPRNPDGPRPDRDFVLMLHEWRINVGASRPDPNEMMEFNTLTMNAKCFPGTQPLIVKKGDRVRVRIGNLSAMDHHPIHLHGYSFTVTETDGGVIPPAGRWPETTVLVPVGSTRTVEFVADNPGDWAMHCHMTHHVMNQMGHGVPNMIGVDARGLDSKVRRLLPDYMTMGQEGMAGMTEMGMAIPPNSIPMVGGVGPYDEITMGGMFTILKVRESLDSYDTDPGWYAPPEGTLSLPATEEALKHNEIAGDASTAPRAPAAAVRSWELAKPGSRGQAPHHPMHPEHGAP